MNKKISVRVCILLCLICVAFTTTVLGSGNLKEIVAHLNYSIGIVVNGEVQTLQDAQGKRVYPISYNGTTYLPVRAVGEILGAEVNWDSENGNVVIKSDNIRKVEKVNMLAGLDKKANLSYTISDKADKFVKVKEQVVTFENGLYCKMLKNQDFQVKDFVGIPVNKGIKTVNFEGFASKSSSVNVVNQQGKLLKTFYLQPNQVMKFSCPIDSTVTDVYFVVISQTETINTNDYVKIFNVFGE